ncbi:MAG: hypothetical protein ACRC7S_00795 [Cetobacterium sp.]
MIDLNQFPKLPKHFQNTEYWGKWNFLRYPEFDFVEKKYLISTKGFVISLFMNNLAALNTPTIPLKIGRSPMGYAQMKGASKARAILYTFVGDPPGKPKSIFVDGNKYNYDLENLRWK